VSVHRLHGERYGATRTTHIFHQLHIICRRALRAVAIRAIDSKFADPIAGSLIFFNRRRAFHLRGRLAGIRYRNADHTDFWAAAEKAYPMDPEFTRNKIHAALRSGRVAEAEAGLDLLVKSRAARAIDCNFVIGLAHFDQRAGNIAGVRKRIRCFLASLKGTRDYRTAAVRLGRVIFAHFPRRPRHGAGESGDYRRRLLSMIARSQICGAPADLLRRAALCEAKLESSARLCLFDTDISVDQCRAFVSLVRGKLAAGQPFSFVRIGDGDAACLPYEPALSALALMDAMDRERIWWGTPLKSDVRARLSPLIARAMWDADCIGVPTIARFVRQLHLQQNDALELSLTGRGLRSVLYCAERFETLRSRGLAPPAFTSCHLHQDMARRDCYGELLDGVGEIVLISCHPGLADWVQTQFGTKIAGNIVLPPDRVSGPLLRRRIADRRTLPEMLGEVVDMMGEQLRHKLVLVGAGYPGKWLVAVARERGGVALDLGSVFDYWLGLPTRSYLDMSPV